MGGMCSIRGEIRNTIVIGNLKERDQLGNQCTIIQVLKCISEKQKVRLWTGFSSLMMGSNDGFLWPLTILQVYKKGRNFLTRNMTISFSRCAPNYGVH